MRNFVFPAPSRIPHFCIVEGMYTRRVILTIMQKYLYMLSLLLLSLAQAKGQGWERIYGGSGQDAARSLAPTPDGGYIMAGYFNGTSRIFLIKTDADGKLQWSKQIAAAGASSTSEAISIVATRDTGYAIAGYVDADAGGLLKKDIYILKTDAYGNKLWDRTLGGNLDDEARAIKELPDGSLVVTGYQSYANNTKENLFALKMDFEGNTIWFNTYGAQEYNKKGQSIAVMPNGDLVIVGESKTTVSSSDDKDVLVVRVDANGALVWNNTYTISGSLGNQRDDEGRAVSICPDGALLIAGGTNAEPGNAGFLLKIKADGDPTAIWQKLFQNNDFYALATAGNNFFVSGYETSVNNLENLVLLKLNLNGEEICKSIVGRGGFDAGFGLVPVRGGAVIAGTTEQFLSPLGESYAYLVKADQNCTVRTSYIQANIFRDYNANCQPDNGEPGLRNWIVRIEGQQDTLFTVANADGDLKVEVDTGTYNMILFPPNSYWRSCDSVIQVHVPNFYDTVYINIPARTQFDCPRNEIDITTPILRRCADNVYHVRYCNSGTVPSLNTKVLVTLDPALTLSGSSITAIPQGGNVFLFELGTVNNGDCGDFTVTGFLDCGTQTGETHCVTASITPKEFCGNNSGWDGAIVAAKAFCENDSVKMILQNVGTGNMGGDLGYVITEDVVMLTPPGSADYRFQLPAGHDSLVWSHLATGNTFRIIAQQSPNYPGTSYPTAAVEGCKTDTSSSEVSLGFYTMFPEDDADVFVETDCQESNEADFNPLFLKRGHPKGYDVAHYVSPQTDLDFLIQFQNTSADTVQQVVIRDTLSAALDPATVYPGASSHPYQFDILGNGIVQYTLTNLNLPPGGGVQSEGFVKFRVSQKPNLPCETNIFNSAAIYFDFNAPIFSNTTYHTVCPFDSFIVLTKTKDIYAAGADLKVYPNPTSESVNFEVKGVDAQSYDLFLYDIQGRLISNHSFNHPNFRLFRHQLPKGEIIYQLAANGKLIASGKLIVQQR